MVNEQCVSSCDGFVWMMSSHAKAKLYGFPQAADSAYSRIRIDAVLDHSKEAGFRIEINGERAPFPEGFITGQSIAVSRAVDAQGKILNGEPLELQEFVPYLIGESYPARVLNVIENKITGN